MWVKTKLTVGALVVFAMALWVFKGTTTNQFAWDSFHYLFRNEDHIARLSLENIYWMFSTLEFYNWHPLTWLSWAIDYQIYGGLDSSGFHLSNNILHSINSALVYILILVVFGLWRSLNMINIV